jgi:hypothetical protein
MRQMILPELISQPPADEPCAQQGDKMKRNDDDNLRDESKDGEPNQDDNRALDSAPKRLAQEADEQPAARSQELDEQAHYAEGEFARPEPLNAADEHGDRELSDRFAPLAPLKTSNRKRRLVAGVALLLITGGIILVLLYTLSPSRSVKVNITTKKPGRASDATANSDKAPDDVTAEAIAEVRSAISNPSGGATSAVPGSSLSPRIGQSLTPPASSTVLPSDSAAADTPAEAGQHEASAPTATRRNQERSIRFASDGDQPALKANLKSPRTDAVATRPDQPLSDMKGPATSLAQNARSVANASRKLSAKPIIAPVVLPSFGSVLPVRTLGKIYTLRSGSSIRLELTRYVQGEGWSLPKGTVLIGQVRGSEQDRAFIAITGFIEPSRDRFVKLNGEILGDDGGSGVRGKFHKLSSGWSRAFARVGSAAVNVAGAIAGSRISGQPVIITDVGSRTISPFSSEVDSTLLQQTRGFVEVAAGTPGFVMVTTLPADVEGVDAEPDNSSSDVANGGTNTGGQRSGLTQEELALLLTSGDPDQIREALPRMSPQMRRIAEVVLAESSHQRPEKD